MNFNERPIIITDFETTGLDPQRHEIIEVGAIKVTHALQELARFDVKIRPLHIERAQPKALEVNGYTPELWADALPSGHVAREFQRFAADGILCAWPIGFESKFLDAWLQNTGTPNLMEYRERDYYRIDIPSIAWLWFHDGTKLGLETTGAHFGLEPEQKPHRGIRGAEYELAVLKKLRGLL